MQNLSALVCCLVVALSSVFALAGAKTVVCWGDSITEGMAMKRNETYPAWLQTAFGEQAVDFRSEAIRRGLAAEGLVATELDRTEMAAGRVPPSLLYGNRPNCHLNAKGYDFLAQLLFERGRALKYW